MVFQYDEGLAAHQRVEEILQELHQQAARDQAVAGPDAPVEPTESSPDDDRRS